MHKRTLLLVFLLPFLGLLQAPRVGAADEAGVARVSLIHGDISTLRGDSGDWVAAVVNSPLVVGDTIATGIDSRTEIQLDHANILRLDQQAQVKIADLSPSHIQMQLSQGRVDFVVLRHSEVEVEIDTPNVAIHPFGDGVYRIQVNSGPETEMVVRRGEAEISTAEGSTNVQMDQLIQIRGADNPEYQVVDAPPRDAWDEWNQGRDHEILEARSWQHTNTYYTGASDLDRHGRWVQVPGYDWCWTPYVDEGWVPYRVGRWVWEPYWGWTWVSYEPWGWAPYHYGRWFFYTDSWVWWPGPPQPAFHPVYAPAYVTFLGFGFGGRNWSFGAGYGYQSVGWLPVGPSDAYYPWSGPRNTYNRVNVTNITNVTNVTNITNIQNGTAVPPLATTQHPVMSNLQTAMGNARARGAITTVSSQDFENGRFPHKAEVVDVATLRQAHLVQGTVPVVPTAESLRPGDRPANPLSIPQQPISAQHFFVKSQPPAGPRPFAERVAELRQMVQQRTPTQPSPGKSGTLGTLSQAQHEAGQAQAERSSGRQSAPTSEQRPGWSHFGTSEANKASPTSGAQPIRPATPAVREENIPVAPPPTQRAHPVTPTVREENIQPTRVQAAPHSSREPNAPEPSGENSRRSVSQSAEHNTHAKSARPDHEAARPGWHRFGETGSRVQERPEKSHPREQQSPPREKRKDPV